MYILFLVAVFGAGEPSPHQKVVERFEEKCAAIDKIVVHRWMTRARSIRRSGSSQGAVSRDLCKQAKSQNILTTEAKGCISAIARLSLIERFEKGVSLYDCVRWGKNEDYLAEMNRKYIADKNTGHSKEEILSSYLDTCVKRVDSTADLANCRSCIQAKVTELFAPPPPIPPKASQTDFRRVRWGMTKAEVRATESGSLSEVDGNFLYLSEVDGVPCSIAYSFTNGILTMAALEFPRAQAHADAVARVIKRITDKATREAGPPIQKVVEDGHPAVAYTVWQSKRTRTAIMMFVTTTSVDVTVMFASVKYANLPPLD